MSQFKELKNFLKPDYLELKEQIFHPNTVWSRNDGNYLQRGQDQDREWFSHVIISRPSDEFPYSWPASSLAKLASHALQEILNDNGIKVETFHRIAVNLTVRQPDNWAPGQHHDHEFDYKHLIIYLNDSDGDTIMFNNKKQIIDRSTPKEDKVISFGKEWHTAYLPMLYPNRKVIVATYS